MAWQCISSCPLTQRKRHSKTQPCRPKSKAEAPRTPTRYRPNLRGSLHLPFKVTQTAGSVPPHSLPESPINRIFPSFREAFKVFKLIVSTLLPSLLSVIRKNTYCQLSMHFQDRRQFRDRRMNEVLLLGLRLDDKGFWCICSYVTVSAEHTRVNR